MVQKMKIIRHNGKLSTFWGRIKTKTDHPHLKGQLKVILNHTFNDRFRLRSIEQKQFKRQGSNKDFRVESIYVKTALNPFQSHQSQHVSPIRDHLNKCLDATKKSVEIDHSALISSRLIDSKVHKHQRKTIHRKLKFPRNETEAKRCITQFVQLFKKDCQPALEESNEFFQMKKIQLKSTLAKETNPFNLKHKQLLQDDLSHNFSANIFGGGKKMTNSFDTKQKVAILKEIPRDGRVLLDELQTHLKYNRSPNEIKYLEKIEKIIRDAKDSVVEKTKKESADYQYQSQS